MNLQVLNFLLVILFSLLVSVYSSIRTCENEADYYDSVGSSCSLNPDGYDSPSSILQRWGCTVEEYNLVTDDGYEFLVIRAYKTITSTIPIIMGHGIYTNSRSFLSMGNETLAYNLLNSGRQIFFINFRGTIYSTGNINGLTQNDYDYWSYSFHHLGVHEVRKTVDFVYTKTSQKSILIGYSMGTTANFIYSSLYPSETTTKVKGIIALAPIGILNILIPSILGKLAPTWPLIQPIAKSLFNGKILPRNEEYLSNCASGPAQMLACYTPMTTLFGIDYESIDYPTRPVTIVNNPDAIGENVVAHYSQVITCGKFQQFDYGPIENMKVYGHLEPPLYPLEKINVPVTFVVGSNDWLATPQTSQATYNKLSLSARCRYITVPYAAFSHDDFLNSKFQYEYLNQPLLTTISNMDNGQCI